MFGYGYGGYGCGYGGFGGEWIWIALVVFIVLFIVFCNNGDHHCCQHQQSNCC